MFERKTQIMQGKRKSFNSSCKDISFKIITSMHKSCIHVDLGRKPKQQKEENMDIIDWQEEFSPPDEDRINFYLALAESLQALANELELSTDQKDTLGLASHHLMVLLSMTLSGYALYKDFRTMSELLFDEVERFQEICSNLQVPQEVLHSAASNKYQEYVKQND